MDGHSPTAVTDLSQITLPNGPSSLHGNNNTNSPATPPINTTPVREKKKAKRSLKISSPNVSNANNLESNKNVANAAKSGRPLQLLHQPPPPPPPLETRVEGEGSSPTGSPAKRMAPSDGAEAPVTPSSVHQEADSTTGSDGSLEQEVSSTTNEGANDDHGSRASSEEVSDVVVCSRFL